MYTLETSYGKSAYEAWQKIQSDNLATDQISLERYITTPQEACQAVNYWEVSTYEELINAIAFLTSMNKRLTLYYRGQSSNNDPTPILFRKKWYCFDSNIELEITDQNRISYWKELQEIGKQVYKICTTEREFFLPRWRGLRDTREVQWSIIKHYDLWPTPMIDITRSLRVATSFAFTFQKESYPKNGYLFVVGMPNTTGSITFDIDQQLCLANLQSACPPIAKRPHLQDGFLVSRFPIYSITEENSKRISEKSTLLHRVVAVFKLNDNGNFWNNDFTIMRGSALMPEDDPLLIRFLEEFGLNGPKSIGEKAASFNK